MSEFYIFLAVIAFVSLAITFAYFPLRHRQKEKDALNSIGLNILALESGYKYLKEGKETNLVLIRNKVCLASHVTAKNVFFKERSNATIQIFDYRYSTTPSTFVVGLLVEFESANFPLFDIDHKDTRADLVDRAGFPRIKSSDLPAWLMNHLSVYTPLYLNDEVTEFLEDKANLLDLFKRPQPQRIYVNKNFVVVYFAGKLKNDAKTLEYLEAIAVQIIKIFEEPQIQKQSNINV